MRVLHWHLWQLPVVVAICMAATTRPSPGAVIVNSWELTTILDNAGNGNFDLQSFTNVQNPFNASHNAMPLPTSFAQAAYNFIWGELTASFQTTVSQQAHRLPLAEPLHCRTSGFIFVQPSFDSVLSVQESYTYTLPPDSFIAQLTINVRDMNTNVSLWSESRSANSFAGNPVSGTFALSNGSIPLIGGHTYRLIYDYRLDTFGGPEGIGTGVGGIQWTLNPVPEAGSLSMLACSIPLLLRGRRARMRGFM